jgi:hypothetical protein
MKSSLLRVLYLVFGALPLASCGGDGGDTVMCSGPGMSVFPTFNKSCGVPADCVIGLHQTSCCGSMVALGLNQAEKARFDADEKICDAMYPGCGCAAAPTAAEDGQMVSTGKTIVVDCQAGQCLTAIR